MNKEKVDKDKVMLLPYDLGKKSIPDITQRAVNILNEIAKRDLASGNEPIGRLDRLIASGITGLIVYDNVDVGFMYATEEHRFEKAWFIDMAIIDEYRGCGIGSIILDKLSRRYNGPEYLIGEVKKSNIASNNISSKYGAKIPFTEESNNKFNYYIFPKERLDEFLKNEGLNFEVAMSGDTESSMQMVRKIINHK